MATTTRRITLCSTKEIDKQIKFLKKTMGVHYNSELLKIIICKVYEQLKARLDDEVKENI